MPEYYDETYKFFTKKGYRVLALSYKTLNPDKDYEDVEREELECDLIVNLIYLKIKKVIIIYFFFYSFAGFIYALVL